METGNEKGDVSIFDSPHIQNSDHSIDSIMRRFASAIPFSCLAV